MINKRKVEVGSKRPMTKKQSMALDKKSSTPLKSSVNPAKKKSPKPLKQPTGLAAVAKRFNITAREARDIATAVGTSMQGRKSEAGGTKDFARENLIRQIKEVGTAAKSGKKGSTSDKFIPEYSSYYPGYKRKKLG
jgi:hypothetical protein